MTKLETEGKLKKSVQKELLCEMMRKDEESGVYDEMSIEKLKNDYLRGEYELDEFVEQIKITQDKQLRESSEKVVWKWNNKCAITAEDIQQIEKALK